MATPPGSALLVHRKGAKRKAAPGTPERVEAPGAEAFGPSPGQGPGRKRLRPDAAGPTPLATRHTPSPAGRATGRHDSRGTSPTNSITFYKARQHSIGQGVNWLYI
ncbi:hypothetical protein DIPPA_53809, partial [Diplonema papillatum]